MNQDKANVNDCRLPGRTDPALLACRIQGRSVEGPAPWPDLAGRPDYVDDNPNLSGRSNATHNPNSAQGDGQQRTSVSFAVGK